MTAGGGGRALTIAAGVAIGLAAAGIAARPAAGAIPSAEKIASAVAAQNRASGRDRVLAFRAAIRRSDGEIAAIGEIVTHPAGRARLELRERDGTVERHLLAGSRYAVSRNGRRVPARPLLPPLPLLQAASPGGLRAVLGALGGDPEAVALGHTDVDDCYVLGGRDLPADGAPDGRRAARVSLWVELTGFEAVRIDRGRGARYRLGPAVTHEGLHFPSWIDVELPGEAPLRLELRDPRAVDPDPAAFDPAWLLSP